MSKISNFETEIDELSAEQIKEYLLRSGIWEQRIQRLKHLIKTQGELWKLYEIDGQHPASRLSILENIVNIQNCIDSWYSISKSQIVKNQDGFF
jgi:hypothetical protein